jgi:hypothetical protein
MKHLLILALTLSLSGCFYQSANNTDLKKAVYFCDGINNIERINVHFNGAETVRCLSGKVEYTGNINIELNENEGE